MDPQTGGRRTATFLPEVAAHEGWDKQQVWGVHATAG